MTELKNKVFALLVALKRTWTNERLRGHSRLALIRKALLALLKPGFGRRAILASQISTGSSLLGQHLAVVLDGPAPSSVHTHADHTSREIVDAGVISIIMPVYNTPLVFLQEVLASVAAQTYAKWELCIADDASSDPEVALACKVFERQHPGRVNFTQLPAQCGIVGASNAALALCTGDWVAYLDHDDTLTSDALAEMAAAIAPEIGVIYSDHDCQAETGEYIDPFFKPDWSPDLFLSQMYIGHLTMFRRSLLQALGGLRQGTDGSQDYDLALRCMASGARFAHVPKILYHWRRHAGSTSSNADSKPFAHEAGRRALQYHLDARTPGAWAEDGAATFCYDVRYPIREHTKASIIIPTRDRVDLLETCVASLRAVTLSIPYEIIVVDNGSSDPETLDWLEREALSPDFKIAREDSSFNWSKLNNIGARLASGSTLVFLNNDTEFTHSDWLRRIVENAQRPEIGVVGPLLQFPDTTIQHAGVVLGLGGWADHVFRGMPAIHHQRYYVSPTLRRNVLAVTGACMAIEMSKFEKLGRFDESFIVCGSDVELCLRSYHAGLSNLYLAEARLIHHESKTRDPRAIPEVDFERSAEKYHPFRTEGDPYFNPNLDYYNNIPTPRGVAS